MSAPRAIQLNTVTTGGSPAAIDDLATRGADLACRAFSVQGDKAFAFTRRAAAHHEAGHAVINALDGIATDVLQGQAQSPHGHARLDRIHRGRCALVGHTRHDAQRRLSADAPYVGRLGG